MGLKTCKCGFPSSFRALLGMLWDVKQVLRPMLGLMLAKNHTLNVQYQVCKVESPKHFGFCLNT